MKKNKELIQVNELSKDTKTSMRTRTISAIVALSIVIPCVILGDWFFVALIAVATVFGTYEISKIVRKKHLIPLYVVALLCALLVTFWPLLRNIFEKDGYDSSWTLWGSFEQIYLSITIVVFGIVGLFWVVVSDATFTVRDACFTFTIGLAMSLGLQSLLFLRYFPIYERYTAHPDLISPAYFNVFENAESCSLLMYSAIATIATDTGAYFFGLLFGKTKMNPRISPKKTWEGFFGGVATSAVMSSTFAFILAATGHPILDMFTLDKWFNIVILSLIIPLFATLGDLTFSSVKRHYDIKDFGTLIPGHGGVLDRLDSLIFAALSCSLYVIIFIGVGNPLV